MSYRFLRFLFGLAVRAFFRDIRYEHLERIPESGPVLLLPNHPNGLIDPFMILIALRRPVSLTAKSTLKKNPFLALLFVLGRVVPLQRRQDQAEGADLSKNAEAFVEARKRLKDGGAICLFPEGISHNQPALQPLKTGAARIALEYLELDGDPGGLKIIPVGIDYMRKERFRSSVLVRVAEPIRLAEWCSQNPDADARALMAEVAERLRQSTLNFEERKESVILSYAAELRMSRGAEPARIGQAEPDAASWVAHVEAVQAAYRRLKGSQAERLAALGAQIRAYRTRLDGLGILQSEVFIDMSMAKAALFCLREGLQSLLLAPLALLGLALYLPPYLGCLGLTALLTKDRDVRATYAVFSAVLFFPLSMLAYLALAAWSMGRPGLALAGLALPLSLAALLSARDHAWGVFRRSRTFLRFLFDPSLRASLVGEARQILDEFQALRNLNLP